MNRPRMLSFRRQKTWLLAMLLFCLTANSAAGAEKMLIVSAAISLKDVLTRLSADFEKHNGPVKILYNFAGSGQLRAQIENGAPADVFVSASAGDMDKLSQKKMIHESSRINLVANHLVLIVNKKRPPALKNVSDLTNNNIQRIAIGNPATVPAGQYAKDALGYYKLYGPLTAKLILGENVRQVLDYVARGEVDCGFVYTTDALVEKAVAVALELPDNTHKPIIYPAAVMNSSKDAPLAGQFVKFFQQPENTRIFKEYGFEQGK
jgi:molybdate transport system substrate-binding protein